MVTFESSTMPACQCDVYEVSAITSTSDVTSPWSDTFRFFDGDADPLRFPKETVAPPGVPQRAPGVKVDMRWREYQCRR